MSAQQIDDELEPRGAGFGLRMHGEPAIISAGGAAGWDDDDMSSATAPRPTFAGLYDLKVDESDRPSLSVSSGDGQAVRALLILGGLAVSCSLAWIVMDASLGGPTPGRLPPTSVSSSVHDQKLASSAPILESQKEDRLQVRSNVIRKEEREAAAKQPASPKISSFSASTRGAAQQHTSSITRGAVEPEPRVLTPVPETKPTTIEGWTVREVTNGVVVLEGPKGIWRATRGETVPGLGRVESIVLWGNRWIVATSKGLVSTP